MKKESAFERFGVMLDCSRNAVMKVSEVKNFIDCLQKMGYNTLELYTEDTYEIQGEPFFGYMRGRYTGAELKEIDAYAKSKGVELIPCVQTLGHFTAMQKSGEYSQIMDTADILLVDEPKTYELIDKIFATLAENFTSRQVNIGMDEAHMVGLGKYLDKHGYVNRFELLVNHLNKVVEIAKKYGFQAHMWSDMFFRLLNNGAYYTSEELSVEQELVDKIPDVALAYWDYYHDKKADYDMMLDIHAKLGKEIWFAGGAWSWNGFAPLNAWTLKSMKPAMASVAERGVKNVLITLWGDNGKECSYYALLPSLYAIRQYANGNFDENKIEKGFYDIFKVKFGDFMKLDLPNRFQNDYSAENNLANPSKGLLYADPFMGIFDKALSQERAIPYASYAKELRSAGKRAGKYAYLFTTLASLCEVLTVKAELGIRTRRAYDTKDKKALAVVVKDYARLPKLIQKFHRESRALWELENKPFGWEIQDIRLGGLTCRIETCKARLIAYIKGKIDTIAELDETLLQPRKEEGFARNIYQQMVSASLL